MDQKLQEEMENSRKSNDTEDRFDELFADRLGFLFARFFIKLRFTPNMVTALSMLSGICGGFFFVSSRLSHNLIGILLEILAAVLDCTDGQVARLTNHRTRFGRLLDGISDGCCFAAMYIGLGIRLMGEEIPFSGGKQWGLLIWPIVLVCGILFHAEQCRMADYYRNVHLFFLNNAFGSELSRSQKVRAEYEAEKQAGQGLSALALHFYLGYTKAQERKTPRLQALLRELDKRGSVPEELSAAYVRASRRSIRMTNLLTYNLRAYSLFILLLLRLHVWYFAFVMLGLGLLELVMVRRYEKIAADLLPMAAREEGKV